MKTNLSMAWLREAVGGIKYPPDRRKVEKELYNHILDRNRDFLKAGCTEREADEKVCAAMGDPAEVRRELAAIHRPFWGYAYLALRILVIAILIITLFSIARYNRRLANALGPLVDKESFAVSQWFPQSSGARCGDYGFRLKQAGYARTREDGENVLLLVLEADTRDPFLGAPMYSSAELTLQDNRGGEYPVAVVRSRELVFTSRCLFQAEGFSPGAEWAVLTLRGADGPVWFSVQLGEGVR